MNRKALRREYRGPRTVESISHYIKDMVSDPVVIVDMEHFYIIFDKIFNSPIIFGYFNANHTKSSMEYDVFRKVATNLRDYCDFYWIKDSSGLQLKHEDYIISFKSSKTYDQIDFPYQLKSYEEFNTWATRYCIPIVREINFQNAEEIIEEKLPLIILFHLANDTESIKSYIEVIQNELVKEIYNVNFVTANAEVFSHPLEHLGKTLNDLPIIAIDTFRHMYLFPIFNDVKYVNYLLYKIIDLIFLERKQLCSNL